jgi:hypothetical protein
MIPEFEYERRIFEVYDFTDKLYRDYNYLNQMVVKILA